MVGSGTRKARAISAVVSPPSNRERQRGLRFGRDGRMAAGEYQAQAVIAHVVLLGRVLLQQLHRGALARIARRFAAQLIDRAVARGGDDPAGGRGWHAALRPARERRRERVLDRFLGELDVTEEAHQNGNRTAVLAAEYRLRSRVAQCPSMNGRTSMGVPMARASLRPQPSAASRSGALRMVMPPICSLLSMNGPSVVTTSPF